MGRPLGFDVQIRHADPRTLLGLGGSTAKTQKSENFSFGRAKHDAPPKVKSQNKYKNDHLLTRSGKRGALVLGRMARVLAPKPPKVEPPKVDPRQPRTELPVVLVAPQQQPKQDVQVDKKPKTFTERMSALSEKLTEASSQKTTTGQEEMTNWESRLSQMRGMQREILNYQPDPLATPKERVKAGVDISGGQTTLKSQADKALGEIGKELSSKTKELKAAEKAVPLDQSKVNGLKDEVGKLTALRRSVIAVGIGSEFPGLSQQPLSRGGAITSLWSLVNSTLKDPRSGEARPEFAIENAYLKQELGIRGQGGRETLEIGHLIDAFNGCNPIIDDNGTALTPDQLKRKIDDLARKVGGLMDNEQAKGAATELRKLSAQLEVQIALGEAVTATEGLLDKSLSTHVAPKFPNGFPLSSAMKAIANAMPHSHQYGAGSDPGMLINAASSVAVFLDVIARGETAPVVHGIDETFDNAVVLLKQTIGGDMAVDKYKEDRAKGPLPGDDVIALLGRTDDQLTVSERAKMLDVVGTGRLATLDEAREILRQAKLDIDTARAEGGAPAVKKLRDERAKGPLLPDDLIALLDKTDEQLTVKERARLLDVVGTGRDATLAQARAIIQRSKDDITAARNEGKRTAGLRHELTLLDKKLSGLFMLETWRDPKLYKPWSWGQFVARVTGEKTQVGSSLANREINKAFMDEVRNRGGQKAGREIAILIARFSALQRETVRKEQQVLGLRPERDFSGMWSDIDQANPLAHAGISNEELIKAGLTQRDIDEVGRVGKLVEALARQGVGNMEDVMTANESANDVGKIVLRSELAQEAIRGLENESARALGAHLLSDILTDSDLRYRREYHIPERQPKQKTVGVGDHEVVEYFKARNKKLEDVVGQDGMRFMKQQSKAYRGIEIEIAKMYRDHMDIDDEIEKQHKVLTQANENRGFNVDANDPRGLKSAKLILEALDAQREVDEAVDPNDKRAAQTRLKEVLNQLSGFDSIVMHTPWHAKLIGNDKPPKIEDLAALREVAQAIIYLRETAPQGKELLTTQMSWIEPNLEQIIKKRREAAPEAMQHVTSMVRAAVLAEWHKVGGDYEIVKGEVVEKFDPSSPKTREAIETTLKSWGLDIEAFTPEIDSVVYSRMAREDIGLWGSEMRFSDAMLEQMRDKRTMGEILHPERLIGRRGMDPETRDSLLSMLNGFQEGDKIDLKAGQRVTLDSGKVGLEGQWFVRAKLAGAHLGQMEVELGSDGYKIHFRSGLEGKLYGEGGIGRKYKFADYGEVGLEAAVGLEGAGSVLTGDSWTFPKTDQGRQALVNMLGKLIDGEKVGVKDWEEAIDVGHGYEGRLKGTATGRAGGSAQLGFKPDPNKSDVSKGGTKSKLDDDTIGVGVSIGMSGSISLGGKWVSVESLNQTTHKRDTEVSTTLGANVGVYAKFWNVLNMGTGEGARDTGGQTYIDGQLGKDNGSSKWNLTDGTGNMDLLNVGVSVTSTGLRKWKFVTSPDGQFTGCEHVRQSNSDPSTVLSSLSLAGHFANTLDTPQMALLLSSKKPEHEQFAKELQTFMKLMGPRDHIAVTYGPKEGLLDRANGLIARAISAKRDGDEELARGFMRAAGDLVEDESNYVPTKIGLLTIENQKLESTNINARFIKWDTFSDGKSEHRGIVMAIPKP
jgi:hypothetical protein